jgi:RNA polymerase sigma-32 factor
LISQSRGLGDVYKRQYNISAERVRQIEKNAMDKIKEAMLANTHLQLD